MNTPNPEALLEFWFGDLTDGFADEAHRALWFNGGDAFDTLCRDRFAALPAAARSGELDPWLESVRGALAYVLVCDQLPRNMYRGTPDAFGFDGLARDAAGSGIEQGFDRQLQFDERAFFYLPFEHSERIVDQHTSVGLFTALRDATPQGKRHLTGSSLGYAQGHRDIILRFGRFPHRNAVLGRASTPPELEYLEHSSGYGQ